MQYTHALKVHSVAFMAAALLLVAAFVPFAALAAEEGGGDAPDLTVTATQNGAVLDLSWSAVTAEPREGGEPGLTDAYGIIIGTSNEEVGADLMALGGEGDLSVLDVQPFSATSIRMVGFTPGETYYFVVGAFLNGSPAAYDHDAIAITFPGKSFDSQIKPAKPTFVKSGTKKKELKMQWKKPSPKPSSYNVEIRTSGGTKVKKYTKVSATATKKTLKSLKPGRKYKVRVQSVYKNVYNIKTHQMETYTSPWSVYSKTTSTKK